MLMTLMMLQFGFAHDGCCGPYSVMTMIIERKATCYYIDYRCQYYHDFRGMKTYRAADSDMNYADTPTRVS